MMPDATAPLDISPAHLLQQACSLQGHLEYMIAEVRRALVDDKLTAETRLVMVALQVSALDQQNDALDHALMRVSAALRQKVGAEPA